MELRLALMCQVCAEELAPWYRDARVILAKALGATKYEICCCCGQSQTPEEARDAGYRRKWNRFARRQKAQQRWDDERARQEREYEEQRRAEAEREDCGY